MKRTGAVLLALLLLLLPLQSLALEGYARFGKGSNAIVWPFQYEDSFFDTPGTSYQHALAQASLGMALSAFRKADVPLEESHGDIKTFFEELGFEQPLFSHYHLQLSIISNSLGESMLQGEGAFAPQWQEDKSLRDNLAREHFPESYMAWVSAYNTLEEMRTPTLVYRQLALDGFDKVEVRDEEGNIVASLGFEEGEIVHGPEGGLIFTQVGNELVLNLPTDQDMRVSLRAMGGVLAFLRVKEGQAGYTRMQVYETGELTPREGETFQLTLPRLTGQVEEGTSVYQLAGTQCGFALTHQPNAQALSAQEMNSTFTSMFTQNLATGIAVMLLVFILLLFTILLSVRGLRRSMYKRRLRKCGTPLARAPLHGNFLNRKQPFKIPVKLFGLLVFGTGLAIAVAAVRLGLSWVREIQFIQQRTMFLFSLMYYVPFLVLLVCCAFPAIYAGGYALLWLSDLYMLRTSRLHARIPGAGRGHDPAQLWLFLAHIAVCGAPANSIFIAAALHAAPRHQTQQEAGSGGGKNRKFKQQCAGKPGNSVGQIKRRPSFSYIIAPNCVQNLQVLLAHSFLLRYNLGNNLKYEGGPYPYEETDRTAPGCPDDGSPAALFGAGRTCQTDHGLLALR